MTDENINALMQDFAPYIPRSESAWTMISLKLKKAPDSYCDKAKQISFYSPKKTLLYAIFLGGLGVDRFYLDEYGMGV